MHRSVSVRCEIMIVWKVLLPSENQYKTYCNLYLKITHLDSRGQIPWGTVVVMTAGIIKRQKWPNCRTISDRFAPKCLQRDLIIVFFFFLEDYICKHARITPLKLIQLLWIPLLFSTLGIFLYYLNSKMLKKKKGPAVFKSVWVLCFSLTDAGDQ